VMAMAGLGNALYVQYLLSTVCRSTHPVSYSHSLLSYLPVSIGYVPVRGAAITVTA